MTQPITLRGHDNSTNAFKDVETECLTEAELLTFANKVREAGGAETLSALFPSKVGNADSCLIATSLNFGCEIYTGFHVVDGQQLSEWPNGTDRWIMYPNLSKEEGKELAQKIELPYNEETGAIELPELVGNCANAFDVGVAFQKYAS